METVNNLLKTTASYDNDTLCLAAWARNMTSTYSEWRHTFTH